MRGHRDVPGRELFQVPGARLVVTWLLWGMIFGAQAIAAPPADARPRVIRVADTINPGTAEYITSNIKDAEHAGAPCLILQLDTPGGLLTSTRQIVQEILGSRIPVVVFIAPQGARAGSAGAIITLASDVAAMAPGSNIGAAHPVTAEGHEPDKTMNEKITNDTAAFAESLARTRGRNADWARRAVVSSESIPADKALKLGVIDLMANDLPDLVTKLSGFRLRSPKHNLSVLPTLSQDVESRPMSIKARVVSFLSDPSLSYLIMALGGLCLWVELSHPGLILPGILGAVCLITSLVSFQTLPIDYGALALILVGMGLLVSELFFPTYGILGVGGIACFILGSLFLMNTNVPEFQISLGLILPTAAVMTAFACLLGYLIWKSRRARVRSGIEALVGELGEVRDPLGEEQPGKILIHGELWNAEAAEGVAIPRGRIVIVKEIRGMCLVVAPH